MTAPRCDVSPWQLPRERDPDDREDGGVCERDDADDDGIENGDWAERFGEQW